MLAIELARRGVNLTVLERLSEPPTESRATGIHARTLEIFRQLGLIEQFLGLVRVGLLTPQDPDQFSDPGLRAHERYGAKAGRLLLARPDGYLAAAARLREPERIERYLSALN